MTLSVPLRIVLLAIFVNTLWGANPVAVKVGLVAFPPLWSAFLRFAIGIACVAGWALLAGVRIRPTRAEMPVLVVIAALFTVQIAMMNVGFDRTSGAMGSVLIASNPLFAALFTHFLVAGDRLSFLKVIGLLAAFDGTVLVLLADAGAGTLELARAGNWIVLASAGLLGFRLALSARALREIDEVRVAIWQMALSLPPFAAGALLFETIRWEHLSWAPVAGILYQGAVIAGFGFTAAFYMMRRYPPTIILSFNFVSPIAGVVLAALLLGERVSAELVLGMLVVAAGLYMIAVKVDV